MIPNGYLMDGLIFWGLAPSENTILSKGFHVEAESLRSLSAQNLNELQDQIKRMLSAIGEEYAVQLQWYLDSDYSGVLNDYRLTTDRLSRSDWTTLTRDAIVNKFFDKHKEEALRRERLALFISKRVNTKPKGIFGIAEQLEAQIKTIERELREKVHSFASSMPFVRFKAMSDEDHHQFIGRFLNPTIEEDPNCLPLLIPSDSILENTLCSDGVANSLNDQTVFKMDSYYHAVLVVRRWPKTSYPGIIQHLTGVLPKNYVITQTIFPLNTQKEIDREEKEAENLRRNVASNQKTSLYATIQKKEEKIHALMQGHTHAFNVLTIIRIWDRSLESLNVQKLRLKTAINGLHGMACHEANQEAQLLSLFAETFPGWTGGDRRGWDLYAENNFLADLMPISSTFCGSPTPEAIYEGTENNIVGIECFKSSTPQHAVLIGMTGAGKSVAMFDLLSQTECYYDFTAIIEEGLSYGTYTQLMGADPIIIHPNANLTINYFDTNGLPLTEEHIAIAASLCLKMVGFSQNEDTNNCRLAILTEYINRIYWDVFEDWRTLHAAAYEHSKRLAYVIHTAMASKSTKETFLDVYSDLQELKKHSPEAYLQKLDEIASERILRFEKESITRVFIRNIAYAFFQTTEYPIHSNLVEKIKYRKLSHHQPEEANTLATLLSIWSRNGAYGKLFDGPSTLRIDGKIAHFELGYIPESSSAMKELAGFVVSNWVRQHIMKMPRSLRKRLIFEEVSRFLNIKGGDKILAEAYAQLRKYGCWVCCVTQQYSQLKNSPLRPVIFGNSKMFLLMKQNDRQDLEEIAEAIGLPERAVEEIHQYELPEHQLGPDKASYVMVYTIGGKVNGCGTAKITASKEMLYAASSNGEIFDQRAKNLKKYTNIIEGIYHESTKTGH